MMLGEHRQEEVDKTKNPLPVQSRKRKYKPITLDIKITSINVYSILQLAAISGPIALRHTVSRVLPLLFCYKHYIILSDFCQDKMQNLYVNI